MREGEWERGTRRLFIVVVLGREKKRIHAAPLLPLSHHHPGLPQVVGHDPGVRDRGQDLLHRGHHGHEAPAAPGECESCERTGERDRAGVPRPSTPPVSSLPGCDGERARARKTRAPLPLYQGALDTQPGRLVVAAGRGSGLRGRAPGTRPCSSPRPLAWSRPSTPPTPPRPTSSSRREERERDAPQSSRRQMDGPARTCRALTVDASTRRRFTGARSPPSNLSTIHHPPSTIHHPPSTVPLSLSTTRSPSHRSSRAPWVP